MNPQAAKVYNNPMIGGSPQKTPRGFQNLVNLLHQEVLKNL